MKKKKKLNKVSIVFVENGAMNGKGFDVYMEGMPVNATQEVIDNFSPAQFWGDKMFAVVRHYLKEAGIVQTVTRKQ